MSDPSCRKHRHVLTVAGGVALSAVFALTVNAQTSTGGTNNGAIRFTGGVDVPSVYVFRGILQETDPRLTIAPYGDIGLALHSGAGRFKTVGVNVGVWNSLQTGSSGSDGPSGHLHYREDFHAAFSMGFGGGLSISAGYAALTSPNNMFNTIEEFQLKVAKAHRLNPYGFLASELTDQGQADSGAHKGTYLELGVGPSLAIGPKVTLTIPAKVGLSVKHYYENPLTGKDSKFGWFDIGGLITIPLSGMPAGRFGSWNVHGGADILVFGDTTERFNVNGDGHTGKNKIVGQVGIGLIY